MKVLYPITLDVKKTNIQKHIKAFTSEGGTRELIITLVSGNDTIELTNEYVVSVVGVKPDGTEFANTASVSDGKIHYTLTTQNVAVEGEVDCHIRVLKTNELLYTSKFAIDVEKNLSDEETETSSNEWTELIDALNRVNNMSIVWSGEGAPSTDPEEYPDIEESNFYFDETNKEFYYAKTVGLTITWDKIIDYTTLVTELAAKQDELTAGDGIDLSNDTVSVDLDDSGVGGTNLLRFRSNKLSLTNYDIGYNADIRTSLTEGQNALASKSYADTELAKKQNTLTPELGITMSSYLDVTDIYIDLESESYGNLLIFNNDDQLTLRGSMVATDDGFKNALANYVYTETEVDNLLAAKQALLTAGNGIALNDNTISAKVYSSSDNALSNSSNGLMVSKSALGYDQTLREGLVNTVVSNPLASKSYVDSLITTSLKYEVVQTLPSTPDTHTVYLIPKSTSETNNVYDEYMYISNAWELIGTTEADLSNYYTKTESDTKYQDKLTAGANITISSSNVISASGGGNPITDTAKGSTISLTDSAESPLDAISIMGKSTQNGTPTIDNPVPIVDITSEQISITDGTNTQTANLTKTLRGIPVSSGGNYTDNNNQQWVCDTIERYKDGTGKYIQRVGVLTLNGTETWQDSTNSRVYVRLTQLPNSIQESPTTIFSILSLATSQQAVGTSDNTYIVANGNLVVSPTSNGQRLNATQFASYLETNNAKLEYVLATPIETPLTSEELAELYLDTYYPSTTITANTDVVVEYVVDVRTELAKKQDKLTAGTNITIDSNNVISASGELSIDYNEATNKPQINSTTLSGDKTSSDLGLQDKLTAGTNITIDSNNVISASGGGLSYTFTDGLTESSGTVGIDLASGSKLLIDANDKLDVDLSSKQDTIDTTHKLSADLVTDTSATNKFVPTHSSTESGKVLGVDNQGGLQWVAQSGGGSYSGGDGIDITNDTISVDLKSGSKLQFDNGELDVDLSSKQDKTDITTDTTSTTVSLTLADNHEYRCTQELTSLTLTMPSGDFISSIVFASGSTPTAMTYDSSIKWSGDDVTNGQFVPTEKTYNIVLWYDGINVNGVVRGV